MTQRPSFYVLAGGLDTTTQPMAVPRGRVIACKNYESVAGGYGSVPGFERYNGRQSPTDAYAAEDSAEAGQAAREAARDAIEVVPGSGPVRGVACFNDNRYAWRDNEAATAGILHIATAAGWVPVPLGWNLPFINGEKEIVVDDTLDATGGGAGTVRDVVKTSGTWAGGDAAGYVVLADVEGTWTAGAIEVGGDVVAEIEDEPEAQAFPPGGRYYTVNHNFYGAAERREMYGANGVGPGFAFDGTTVTFIATGMAVNTPTRVRKFKQHLFFAFPGGSLQHSEPGEPRQWSAVLGAGEIAVGSEITDLVSSTNALHILTEDQINTLMGSDATDWVMEPLSDDEGTGAIAHTAQTVGSPMYLDTGGLRSISTTQAFGNFRIGSLINQIQPIITNLRMSGILPVASVVAKNKDQYRVFYSNGFGISAYFGRKNVEPMTFDLGMVPTCIAVEVEADTGERIFAGCADGFVYELDKGTSFDGEEIEAFVQLPWDHEGAPWTLKRWHKVILELDAAPNSVIRTTAEFDYANGEQGGHPEQSFDVHGGGGFWDIATWDQFYWDSPAETQAECYLDGQGKNMSLFIAAISAEQDPHVLQGITKMVSTRGQAR